MTKYDKVWHEELVYKLRRNGVCRNLLQLLISFLDSRKQRVLLNGQCSSWGYINAAEFHKVRFWDLCFFKFI